MTRNRPHVAQVDADKGRHQAVRRNAETSGAIPTNSKDHDTPPQRSQKKLKYPAKSHARRVAKHLSDQKGLIVLPASKRELYSNSDQQKPFRQDRYFYYLTGCNEPGCHVTYAIENDHLTLWLPPINKNRVVWTGRGSTVEEALEKYDIDEARYLCDGRLSAADTVNLRDSHFSDEILSVTWGWLKPKDIEPTSTVESFWHHLRVYLLDRDVNFDYGIWTGGEVSLQKAMDACRVIKDGFEIDLIRKANQITSEAHTNVMRNLHSFDDEASVEAAYMQTCIARSAKQQAYAPIAGAGPNASVLHYDENEAKFGDAQTIVIDSGCEVECYASDVTRTLPINKSAPGYWPSKESYEIYSLVEKVQDSCIKMTGPGVNFLEIYWNAQRMILDGLLHLGLLQGKSGDILEAGTQVGFFPHGLGHHMGLEVHDVSPGSHPPIAMSIAATREDIRARMSKFQDSYRACITKLGRAEHHLTTPQQAQAEEISMEQQDDDHTLQPGMIVTIEPGIYFNDFLLNEFFLDDPIHSKFIDKDVLRRYMPVGGVRIEDDILITKNGYENLTTAPKGKEMLRIIRVGAEKGNDDGWLR